MSEEVRRDSVHKRQSEANAAKPGNGLAAGLAAIVLGLGSAALVIAVGEGNQEILAWPVGTWLALVFWLIRAAQAALVPVRSGNATL